MVFIPATLEKISKRVNSKFCWEYLIDARGEFK
jgi:hypothetical protein